MASTCPLSRQQVADLYFLEHRAKLLDIAAFLDRYDRAADADQPAPDDFRVAALKEAAAILTDGKPHRTRRILNQLSDHTPDPLDSAAGLKAAHGAPPNQKSKIENRKS